MRYLVYILLFVPLSLVGEEVYKTVDDEGNVTYSQEPPSTGGAEVLEIQPGPDETEVEAAIEREQEIESTLDAMDAEDEVLSGSGQSEGDGAADAVSGTGDGVIVGVPGVRRGNFAEGAEGASGAIGAQGADAALGAPTAGDRQRVQSHGKRR